MIETPEEFVEILAGTDNNTTESIRLVTARDAAIRADEQRKAADDKREALIMVCQLCKRLNPQHTGNPDTCKCDDTEFLRAAIMAEPEEAQE